MRKLLSALCSLCLAISVVGCQSAGTTPSSVTEANLNQSIVRHESEIRRAADITTVAVLATIKDDQRRANVARDLKVVSDAIVKAVATDAVDLDGLKAYATTLLASGDQANRDLAGLVVRSLADLVQEKTSTFFVNITPDSRKAASRSLIRAAAGGVADATVSYSPSNP